MRRFDLKIAFSALMLSCVGAVSLAEAPARVVSMNLCTDQLAMDIAAPGQLISVTRISVDPLSSLYVEEARGLQLNDGRAEEIYAMAPDLVLANEWSDPIAIQLLRDLDIEVLQFPIVQRLDEVAGVVRAVGEALGREDVAEAMAAEFEAGLADVGVATGALPEAAFFFANGYSLGLGTLSNDIIERAGFANLAVRLGRAGGGTLSLEELLMNTPDVIITGAAYPGSSRSEAITDHPALAGIPRVRTNPNWVCGTPASLKALTQMRAARDALVARD